MMAVEVVAVELNSINGMHETTILPTKIPTNTYNLTIIVSSIH